MFCSARASDQTAASPVNKVHGDGVGWCRLGENQWEGGAGVKRVCFCGQGQKSRLAAITQSSRNARWSPAPPLARVGRRLRQRWTSHGPHQQSASTRDAVCRPCIAGCPAQQSVLHCVGGCGCPVRRCLPATLDVQDMKLEIARLCKSKEAHLAAALSSPRNPSPALASRLDYGKKFVDRMPGSILDSPFACHSN